MALTHFDRDYHTEKKKVSNNNTTTSIFLLLYLICLSSYICEIGIVSTN